MLRETVAFAAHGLNEFWILRIIEFLTKPGDVHIDGPRRNFAVVLPDFVQNFLAWNHAVAMIHEIAEQLKILASQRERFAGLAHFGAFKINLDIAKVKTANVDAIFLVHAAQ